MIQKILSAFLYYDLDIDCTMLPDLKSIADQQVHPTQNNLASIKCFLDYEATDTDTVVKFLASDKVIHINSDVSYLPKPCGSSRN